MIIIDAALAISLFLSVIFILVFGFWLAYNSSEYDRESMIKREDLIQCPYCARVFSEQRHGLIRCPCCRSIIDLDAHETKDARNHG